MDDHDSLPPVIRFLSYACEESRSILAWLLDELYGPNVICRSN